MPWIGPFASFVRPQPALNTNSFPLPTSIPAAENTRRETRTELEVLMTATTRDGRRFQAYSRDLSQRGSAVIVWGELAIGEKVSLAFRFPKSDEEIVLPAVVRHSIEHRYGMEFVGDHKQLEAQVMKICRAAAAQRVDEN